MAGLGLLGLAGCLGDDDETDVRVGMGTGGTSEEMTQALQRVVDSESESARIITQGTSGDPENVRLYNDGDIDAHTGNNSSIIAAMNDEEPFAEEPVDEVAPQGFLLHTFHFHWLAVEGSGIETTDDLAGRDVWPLQPDWGIRQLAQDVHENAGMWEDLEGSTVDIDAGDVAGAIEEGRVEAFIGYGANFTGLPGWLTEVDARADVYAVETTDTLRDGIDATEGMSANEIDVYGYDQDVGTDTLVTWDEPGQLWISEDVDDDVAYELARVSHEYVDEIREGQADYPDHSDIDIMTSGYMSDVPVHAGVADFLEDNDAWDDSWDRSS
ncbi:TRAP transporter substrate-binding protein [Natrarchaeobius chitinivorans]|uniref:TRAP transporter substrate-binding protein n=2 Tax=Natrarchaeobius chitinivorans TaxID=1679083 RepID=A0A3N6LUZ5_NATCH|nr:TRAP transporter substrate-binding protein [Natrarchaeobius chitinivorans]